MSLYRIQLYLYDNVIYDIALHVGVNVNLLEQRRRGSLLSSTPADCLHFRKDLPPFRIPRERVGQGGAMSASPNSA
jgi:hypothetical protein